MKGTVVIPSSRSLPVVLSLVGGAAVSCAPAPVVADDPPPPLSSQSTRKDGGTPSDGGAGAIVRDAGPACVTAGPNHRCGLAPQCGCALNETCDVTTASTGATSCVTSGPGTLGRPCAQTGDCQPGLTCRFGACRPSCAAVGERCEAPGTGVCVERRDDLGKVLPNGSVCTIACDPRQPELVCGSNTCLWFPDYYAQTLVSDCNVPGGAAALAPCNDVTDCVAGSACFDHPSFGKECEPWCRLGQNDCPNGTTCTDVFGAKAPVVGGTKEGLCQ